jgi:hypothetical protein
MSPLSPRSPVSASAAPGQLIELTPLRAEISYALQHRGQRLLEAADPAAELSQLQPLQAYFVFKELGLHEAGPLLRHASPEQLQTCIDLDCWAADHLQLDELDAWLAAGASESPEALATTFLALDEEVQVLFLRRTLEVHEIHTDSDPTVPDHMLERGYIDTPDGILTLTLRPEDEAEPTEEGLIGSTVDPSSPDRLGVADDLDIEPLPLVLALYAVDADAARRLLFAAKWELDSEVEDRAHQFRAARLGDLGFVDRLDALRIFAKPPSTPPHRSPAALAAAARPVAPGTPSRLPAPYAQALQAPCLLVAAWNQLTDLPTLQRLESELITLINALLVATDAPVNDLAGVRSLAERTEATLSCGLTALQGQRTQAEADPHAAAESLRQWPLRQLFAHGVAVSAPLRQAARAFGDSPAGKSLRQSAHAVDAGDPDADVAALDRRFLAGLDAYLPLDLDLQGDLEQAARPFREPAQVAAAAAALARLAGTYALGPVPA